MDILVTVPLLIKGGFFMKKKTNVKVLAVSSLLAALALILNQLVIFRMPQGGSITAFSMVPIVLCAYFYGVRNGFMTGAVVGLTGLIINPYVIHPLSTSQRESMSLAIVLFPEPDGPTNALTSPCFISMSIP